MSLRIRTRRRARAAGLLVCAAVVATGLTVVGATPAQAYACATEGHAYLTQPGGQVHFSGYNGDQRFGVPSIVVSQGQPLSVGGNGIYPFFANGRFGIGWRAEKWTGPGPGNFSLGSINFFPNVALYETRSAYDNCVVHEQGPFPVAAPVGHYRIFANYTPGKHFPGEGVTDVVADVEVLPGLPRISSAGQANAATNTTENLMSPASSEPDPGGGGGDPNPPPCDPCLPILPITY